MGSAKGACHSEMSLRKELLYVCAVIATKKKQWDGNQENGHSAQGDGCIIKGHWLTS